MSHLLRVKGSLRFKIYYLTTSTYTFKLNYLLQIMAEVGGCGKDTTNSKYTLQGVSEKKAKRDIFFWEDWYFCSRLLLGVETMASWVL